MKRYSLLPVILVGFILFAVLDHEAEAGDFKIYTGSPGYKNFDQIDSCDFDGIGCIDFDTADFNANTMGLDMFARLGGWDMEGKNSKYAKWLTGADFFLEAEARDRFGRQMLGFSWFLNNGCEGEDIFDDDATNDWARWASDTLHNSGNVVHGLRNELNTNYVDPDTMGYAQMWVAYRSSIWFCTQIWIDSTTKYANYCAIFWVKVNQGAQDAQFKFVIQSVHGNNLRDTLAARTVDVSDLTPGTYDSVWVHFHKQYDTSDTSSQQFDTTTSLTDVSVWWNGEDEVWIDGVEIFDEWAWNTLNGEYDDSVTAFINKYQNQPAIKGFGLDDEPEPYRINVNKYWANFIKNHPHAPPYTAHTSWAKAFNFYLDYWFEDTCAVEEHLVNMYAMNDVRTDTSSETCNPPNTTQTLQEAIDALLTYLDIQRVRAHQEQKKLAYNVGAAKAYNLKPDPVLRRPTQWEQEAAPWLAISHGVDVISYWEYSSYYKLWDPGDPNSPDTTAPWYFWWTYPEPDRILVAWVRGLVYADTARGPLRHEDRETHRVEPQWSAVRRVNKQLHAIGDILVDPDSWIAGFTCDEVPQSWVSSFKSERYTNDKAYVEIATFEHNNIDYLLLVNRRCLSTEGQRVRVGLDLPGSQYCITTLEYFEEGDSAAFTDITYSGKLNSEIPLSTYLEPGQGKFFKIVVAQRKS
jgi:hypothetical protein